MKVTHPSLIPNGLPASAEPPAIGSGWRNVAAHVTRLLKNPPMQGASVQTQSRQLGEMIQLQMEVCRYQVKVELVSKVAESSVASVRKLQQTQ